LGRRELRREFGILKAVGWTTREILEKTVLENFVTSLMAASLAVVLCVLWMNGLNGLLIGQFFIAEVGMAPRMELPFRFLPIHGLVCLAFVLLVTEAGGLYAAWAGSRIPPAEAIKR
jgi:ABC-type antimicrobial peptide transport system permease subunit